MGEDKDSKTEKATPKKRRDERKKGNVFLSKDAVAVATLLGSIFILRLTFANGADALGEFLEVCLELARRGMADLTPRWLIFQAIWLVVRVCGPLMGVTILLSIVATFAQTGMLVTAELIKPKFEKINPLKGFQRLFSVRSLVEAGKGLLKIAVLLFMIYRSLRSLIGVSERYLYAELLASCDHLFRAIFSMLVRVSIAFIALAALDFLYQWWDYEKQLRMSKQEIKEEFKQTEGDPQIKNKIKQLQRQMSQSRMMQQVPGADVIIRNPTHVAVALRYRADEDLAPVVLAKGQDSLARRIVALGEEHDVLVVENVPLAHALYAKAELNEPIPPDLYEAVAEIMVYLYKLGRIEA